jgi:hypothetical protein
VNGEAVIAAVREKLARAGSPYQGFIEGILATISDA